MLTDIISELTKHQEVLELTTQVLPLPIIKKRKHDLNINGTSRYYLHVEIILGNIKIKHILAIEAFDEVLSISTKGVEFKNNIND
ncbi:hypothetical protein AU255_13080 [Methyloprofundus sedimenti]|uniref:TnsE C-terminal domain-containing protein n=1 Tax=Methyloprofundus sedimenti TaxID=1420851 RepID=A0A1V8M398_9GAMM|nr:Tn7-like element transposition protein TnsE [Methyloprofundus sedimenti]OQK16041.1 hypothetical protein AU255_13080 [Methyloprofundus sedimenti]